MDRGPVGKPGIGEEVQPVFQSASDAELLNARTGKALERIDSDGKKTASMKPFATNSAAWPLTKNITGFITRPWV
jgi:hypothetical protein